MADKTPYDDFQFNTAGMGANTAPEDKPPPERGLWGYAKDTGIDVARGVVGLAGATTGAKAAISTAAPDMVDRKTQNENLTALEDLDTWLKSGKSATGQYREEHPEAHGWTKTPVDELTRTATGLVPFAPVAATGYAAPFVAAGIGYGQVQAELHKRIREATPDDLKNDPGYAQDISNGVSDDEARDNLFARNNDPTKMKNLLTALPNVAGSAIGAGAAKVLLTRAAQRTVGDWLTTNVLKNLDALSTKGMAQRAGVGGVEAALGGAAQQGGSALSSQMQGTNLDPNKSIDWGTVAAQAGEGAAVFGPMGLIGGPRARPYREYGPTAEVRKYPGTPRPVSPEEAAMIMNPDNPQAAYEGTPTRPTRPATVKGTTDANDLGEDITAAATSQLAQPKPTEQPTRPTEPQPQRPGMPEQPAAPPAGREDWSDMTTPSPRPPVTPPRPPGQWGPEDFREPPKPPPPPAAHDPQWQQRWPEGPENTAADDLYKPPPSPLEAIAQSVPHAVRQQWASSIQSALDKGVSRVMWNRLHPSMKRVMRDTLSPEDHRAVVDAVARDPQGVIDTLLGREGARIAEPEPIAPPAEQEPHAPVSRPQAEAQAQDRREVPPEAYRGLSSDVEDQAYRAQEQALTPEQRRGYQGPLNRPSEPTGEYGEARPVSEEKPYLRGAAGRPRKGRLEDIGLTPQGRFAPGTAARMASLTGEPLRATGPRTPTRGQALIRRARQRAEAREQQMINEEREAAAQRAAQRDEAAGVSRPGRDERGPRVLTDVEHPIATPVSEPREPRTEEELAAARRNVRQPQEGEGRRIITEPKREGLTAEEHAAEEARQEREYEARKRGEEPEEPEGISAHELERIAETRRLKEHIELQEARRAPVTEAEAKDATIREVSARINRELADNERTARARNILDKTFKDLIAQNPKVRAMTFYLHDQARRKETDAARKRAVRAPAYRERERVIENAYTSGQKETADAIEKLLASPSKDEPDIFSDPTKISKQRAMEAGRAIASLLEQQVNRITGEMKATRDRMVAQGEKPVGWGVPGTRSKLYEWYGRLFDLKKQAATLRQLVGVDRTKDSPQKLALLNLEHLRDVMHDVLVREKLMAQGRYDVADVYSRNKQEEAYDWLKQRANNLQRQLDAMQAEKPTDTSPDATFNRKRSISQLKSELARVLDMQEGIEDIGGRDYDPTQFLENIPGLTDLQNDRMYRDMHTHMRRLQLEWANRFLTGDTEAEGIQRERELARTRQDSAKRRLAHEQPSEPTQQDREQRMADLQVRAEEINDELQLDPQYPTAPEGSLERATQLRENTEHRVALQEELRDLETQTRRLRMEMSPRMVNEDYGLGRVLDPAGDLSNRAHLPAGATVRSVDNLLNGRALKHLRLRPDPGDRSEQAVLRNHYLDIVHEVAGDADVVMLTGEQMRLANERRAMPEGTEGFYDARTHRILIDRTIAANPARLREVLLHEFGHPMTEVAIEKFPEIANRLDAVRQTLSDMYYGRNARGEFANPELRAVLGNEDLPQSLSNVHEFLSHLYSDDGRLMDALSRVQTSRGEREAFAPPAERTTMLARTLGLLKRAMSKLFFLVSKKRLLNDAVINSLDLFQSIREGGRQRPTPTDVARPISMTEAKEYALRKSADANNRFSALKTYLKSGNLPLDLHNLSDVEHRGDTGMQGHASNVSGVLDRINATGRRHQYNPEIEALGERVSDVERVNSRAYDELQDYQDLANHYTMHGGDPLGEGRNAHITDSDAHIQQREMYPELKARWDAMTPVQHQLWEDMQKSFDDKHEAMLQHTMSGLIDAKGLVADGAPGGIKPRLMTYILHGDKALSEREQRALTRFVPGYDPTDTAQHAYFRREVAQIRANPMFRTLPVWAPSMRRGDWVTEARYDMDSLKGRGSQIARDDGRPSGEFEHDTPEERAAFIREVMNDPRFKGVHFNGNSDVVYAKDENGHMMRDTNGKPILLTEYGERTRTTGDELEPGYHTTTTEGLAKRVKPKDAGDEGIVKYRSSFNPLLLEFHERQAEAEARHRELQTEANLGHLMLNHVAPIRDHNRTYVDPAKADRIYREMERGVINGKGYRDMDETSRAMLLRDLKEAGIRTMMSTSARSTMMKRTFAQGARKDMIRNFLEYHKNTAHTLAGLEHRTELADALKGMDDYVRDNSYHGSPTDPQGKFGITNARVQATLHKRAMRHPNEVVDPWWSKKLTTLLRMSYLDKLASPFFWILQTIEPWTATAPALAGQFGWRAYPALWRALRDVRKYETIGAGFKGAGKSFIGGDTPSFRPWRSALRQGDLYGRLIDNVRHDPEAVKVLQHMEQHSQLDRNAGLELEQMYDPSRRGSVLDWSDHMSRQINSHIEGVNRAGIGLAAYRLAKEHGVNGKTLSHEEALEYTRKTVHETAGNYNAYASAPIFNNPLFRPMFQFKRYAGRMSSHWMRAIYGAATAHIRNLPPEQKAAAYRQLAYMVGTAVMTSGYLGLPTEPIKAVINVMSPFTGFNSDDAERMAYEASLKYLGPDLGEFLSKGGFRYAGLGIGQRTGYDSLWTFGALGNRPSDWWQAAGHFVAGAPGGYAVDAIQGLSDMTNSVGHLVNGRYTEAEHSFFNGAERLLPVKTIADTSAALRRQLGGPQFRTPTGLPQGIQPEWWETGVQALGAQTSRQQRAGDKRHAMREDIRQISTDKNRAFEIYANASDKERVSVGRNLIDSFNAKWPESKMTLGDLYKARQRYAAKQTADPSMLGVTMSRRNQTLMPRYSMYNVQ
jgi:hypothetical protein